MPEFTAPGLGKRSNHVAIDVEIGQETSGVLYALGGASGGVTLYMDKGQLVYEYNMLIIERTIAKSDAKIAPGKHKIEVDETIARPGGPADVILKVDGQGSGAHDREADRAGGVHCKRDIRRRGRPWLASITRVF